MSTQVEYIVVHNSGSTSSTESSANRVAELLRDKAGEIIGTWIVDTCAHHIVKFEV